MPFDPSEPIFGPDVPEETREAIRSKHEFFKLTMQSHTHEVKDLIDALNSDQLEALDTIIASVQGNPHYMAGHIRGQIAMRQWVAYGVCPCGESHDPDKEFEVKAPAPERGEPTMEEQVGELTPDQKDEADLAKLGVDQITTPDHEVVEVGSDRWGELLKEYNLAAMADERSGETLYLMCMGCSQHYPSLQDRMLKPPGAKGCGGCQQKEKWG